MTLKEQNGLPRSTLHTIFWSHGMHMYHTLKLKNCVNCEMYAMPLAMAKILKCLWQILNLSYPRLKKGGNKKQTPAMGVVALSRQNSFSPNS